MSVCVCVSPSRCVHPFELSLPLPPSCPLSFRQLDSRIFSGLGKKIDWIFLEVHAEGERAREGGREDGVGGWVGTSGEGRS